MRVLGPGWELQYSGPIVDGTVSYGAVFVRDAPEFQLLSIGLADLRVGTPEDNALDYIEELRDVREGDPREPPPFGSDAVRYFFRFTGDGRSYWGDVTSWRQGEVIAIVVVISEAGYSCVCEYAELQYAKLVAAMP